MYFVFEISYHGGFLIGRITAVIVTTVHQELSTTTEEKEKDVSRLRGRMSPFQIPSYLYDVTEHNFDIGMCDLDCKEIADY